MIRAACDRSMSLDKVTEVLVLVVLVRSYLNKVALDVMGRQWVMEACGWRQGRGAFSGCLGVFS